MKSRLLALCMLFVLIVALVPGVMAQDASKAICGNLSADDCTALTTALTNTGAAGSGAFTLASTIDIQSDDPTQAAKVDITADGKFSGATPMSMTDMSAMSADPTAALKSLTEGLKGFSGVLNLTVGLPTSAAAMTGGQPLTLNLILVNGVGYIDFSKLPSTITPMLQAYKIPNGWAGLDLIDTITNAGGMLTGMAGSTGAAGTSTAPSAEDMAKGQALFAKYLTYTHDGDTYTGTVDLKGLFSDADFQAMMKSADSAKEMTDAQQAAIDSLDDATVQVAFTVAGDKLGEVNLTIDLPGSTLTALSAASASSSTDATTAPPTAVNISFDLKYSGLGEAQTIAAPEGAPVAKFADLMALMQGSMGGTS
jgi:hypothetical protein